MVMFEGQRYCLTCLGLKITQLVMKAVLKVLQQDLQVKKGASVYMDDIPVDEYVSHSLRFPLDLKASPMPTNW